MAGWTIETLQEHFEALRAADLRFEAERDRRYAEVNIEREKALKIKETADLAALQLAREIQTYKDEKANELREQINSERGLYATNKDVEPLKAYMAGQTGRSGGIGMLASILFSAVVVIVAIASVVVAVVLRS
jgi:hypothetical protein